MIVAGDKVSLHATGATYRVCMIKKDAQRAPLAYYLEPSAVMDAWVHLLPHPALPLTRVCPDAVTMVETSRTRWLQCVWCHEYHNHWCAVSTPRYTFCTHCRGAQRRPPDAA